MRLLKAKPGLGGVDDFQLVNFNTEQLPPYAILSHTWSEGEEVTYNELLRGQGRDKSGFDKIRFCGERARYDGLEYFWVDTCCINKATSDELNTAINSMFRWYQRADRCYVYLSDVQAPVEATGDHVPQSVWEQEFKRSRWFTRGWTLQELVAPSSVEFFSREHTLLGDRISLERQVTDITGIPVEALRGQKLSNFSDEQMEMWAAKRTTTIPEDRVYCLLGIFGVFLPLIYGEGEAHAMLRLKEERSKRHENRLPTTYRKRGGVSTIPSSRNESFVGREPALRALGSLVAHPRVHRRMTIYGLGGCGKTAVAAEFGYRLMDQNPIFDVFWVPAISQETFELAYREIATQLRLPGASDANVNIKHLVHQALSKDDTSDWLMIVDNADETGILLDRTDNDPGSRRLIDYLPRSIRGSVLFTTRSSKAAQNLTQSKAIKLDDMDKLEARRLMKESVMDQMLVSNEHALDELLEQLTYLPLAIIQAAAFINSNSMLVSDYLALFKDPGTQIELFSEHFEDSSRYEEMESTIARTWHISFDQIIRRDPIAADFLSFMACIDRTDIPQSLMPPVGRSLDQSKALGTLKAYAFITERAAASHSQSKERSFDLHRLVHLAADCWLRERGDWTTWAEKAATRLADVLPEAPRDQLRDMGRWAPYVPHAMHLANTPYTIDLVTRIQLLHRVGLCQRALSRRNDGESALRRALSLAQTFLEDQDPLRLDVMLDTAFMLILQRDMEAARTLLKDLLKVQRAHFHAEHPRTLQTRYHLALVYHYQAKTRKAEGMCRTLIPLHAKVFGVDNIKTLDASQLLAQLLAQRGSLNEAESIVKQSLESLKRMHPNGHVDIMTNLMDLSDIARERGDLDAAESIARDVISKCESFLGAEHVETLYATGSLVNILTTQHKHDEAERLSRELAARSETVLGHENLEAIGYSAGLAGILSDNGKYVEAKGLQIQVVSKKEKILGPGHPDIRWDKRQLAKTLMRQHRYEEAATLLRQWLVGNEMTKCLENIEGALLIDQLEDCLRQQGKYLEVEQLGRNLLAKHQHDFGEDHITSINALARLSLALYDHRKYAEAGRLYETLLGKQQKLLGPDDPLVLKTLLCLAKSLYYQDRHSEAEEIQRELLALSQRHNGQDSAETMSAQKWLVSILSKQGKLAEAEHLQRGIVMEEERWLGRDHPSTLSSLGCLAATLVARKSWKKAVEVYERLHAGFTAQLGAGHQDTQGCSVLLSDARKALQDQLLDDPVVDRMADSRGTAVAISSTRSASIPPTGDRTINPIGLGC